MNDNAGEHRDREMFEDFVTDINDSICLYKIVDIVNDPRNWHGERITHSFTVAKYDGVTPIVEDDTDFRTAALRIAGNDLGERVVTEISMLRKHGLSPAGVKFRFTADGRVLFPKFYIRGNNFHALPQAIPLIRCLSAGHLVQEEIEMFSYFLDFPNEGFEVYLWSQTRERELLREIMRDFSFVDRTTRRLLRGLVVHEWKLGEEARKRYLDSGFDINEDGSLQGAALYVTLEPFKKISVYEYFSGIFNATLPSARFEGRFELGIVGFKKKNGVYTAIPSWHSTFHYFDIPECQDGLNL